jgi:hypothetical protein
LAGDRGGGEVALGIAFTAQLEVIVLASKKATAVEVPHDSSDGVLQHLAHLAGLQMSEARKNEIAPLLGPSAVQRERVKMWIQPHVGSGPLYSGDRASPRTDGALLRRSADVEGLHRGHEDLCEPPEQFTILGEPWPPGEREGQHPLAKRS